MPFENLQIEDDIIVIDNRKLYVSKAKTRFFKIAQPPKVSGGGKGQQRPLPHLE
jgi:hypothetical protein